MAKEKEEVKIKIEEAEEIEGIVSASVDIENMSQKDIKKLKKHINDMIKFLEGEKGVGLAAPQIGVYEKYFIWQHKSGKLFMKLIKRNMKEQRRNHLLTKSL